MKQLAAILLISVFAFSHYARQLAYMECKLANAVKSSAQQCDCEKKYDMHQLNDKKPIALHPFFHLAIDEFYSAASANVHISSVGFLPGKLIMLPSADACKGNCPTPYRPPQA